MPANPLYRLTIDARDLADRYPPAFHDSNKRAVYQLAASSPPPLGTVSATRWGPEPLPGYIPPAAPAFEANPGVFPYHPPPTGEVHWYVNFAAADLFHYYAGPLVAQDELQVLEHPGLASVRHALQDQHRQTLVVEGGQPHPILVTGVERRLELDTAPSSVRPHGLYGNQFAAAPEDVVLSAVRVIDPPTTSNILAIEAPAYGAGAYSRDEIEFILGTAFTGFNAARVESQHLGGARVRTTIHTGFWGCGAYGGNRHLMTVLQLLAARLAALDALLYHAVDARSLAVYAEARELLDRIAPAGQPRPLNEVVAAIAELGFQWGTSNNT